MDSNWTALIAAAIGGGGITGLVELIKFFVKRHDEKKGKVTGTQAAIQQLSDQTQNLTDMVEHLIQTQDQSKKDIEDHGEAIAGLEHDRIVHLGKGYFKSGHISIQDYDDINNYLYKPYKKLGGNGTAETVMNRLKEMVDTGNTPEA